MNKTALKYEAFAKALNAAHAAAAEAQKGMVENPNALDCGFAWVVTTHRSFTTWCRKQVDAAAAAITEPEASALLQGSRIHAARAIAERRYGSKHHAAGWCFWCPGGAPVQAVSIHEAGAKAFVETLSRLGIPAEWSARLD